MPYSSDMPLPEPRVTAPTRLRLVIAASILAILVGCATPPPPAPAPAPVPAPPPPPAPVVEPPKPAPPPVPELSPAQAKAQAQKLAVESITLLQNGDEPGAQQILDEALKVDPANDLAKKLMDQIRADPQKELGTVFFRYTVQRDDSLSKLAQQYLGDRFRFHILAKYNDISNPSKLAAGQVIKIPGRQPAARPPPPPEPPVVDEAAKAAAPETSTPRSASMLLMQQAADLQKAGNIEGAYDAYREAALRDPANRDAATQRDATRNTLARRYEREAAQAFQRQNLDAAINKWDRVLALEPGNQKAKLERERAIELRRKLNEKFGK